MTTPSRKRSRKPASATAADARPSAAAAKKAVKRRKTGKLDEDRIAVAEAGENLLARADWFSRRRRSS
jgi:hypothetical protein